MGKYEEWQELLNLVKVKQQKKVELSKMLNELQAEQPPPKGQFINRIPNLQYYLAQLHPPLPDLPPNNTTTTNNTATLHSTPSTTPTTTAGTSSSHLPLAPAAVLPATETNTTTLVGSNTVGGGSTPPRRSSRIGAKRSPAIK